MEVNTSASIAAFQAKSAADKILSYMWYIHVLVSVNTEARLRARMALVLEGPLSPAPSPERTFIDQRNGADRQDQPKPLHDLTDHLILWLFSRNILTRLVDDAPVLAQANGYACILVDVPMFFREEFCRRLYTLLFSQRIVEWPHGIDVPTPVIEAARSVGVVDAPVELEGTDLLPDLQQEDVGGAGLDRVMEDKDEDLESTASSYRPAASIWLQTPNLRSWDDDDIAHIEPVTYFGTVSNPLLMDYFADWDCSRNRCGPQDSLNKYSVSAEQLKAPCPSPQDQPRSFGKGPEVSLHRQKYPLVLERILHGEGCYRTPASYHWASPGSVPRPGPLVHGYSHRDCNFVADLQLRLCRLPPATPTVMSLHFHMLVGKAVESRLSCIVTISDAMAVRPAYGHRAPSLALVLIPSVVVGWVRVTLHKKNLLSATSSESRRRFGSKLHR